MTKRLLICYAHPDDESFGLGSLIGKYVAEGVEVSLICATNGDVGSVSPEMMVGHTSVAELRLTELDCAAAVLGFKEVIKFGYRDSGMMNSPENADPHSLWQAPLPEVAERIIEVIRRIQPQVVITFDPFGGYGHPDHIKMNKATLEAFDRLKDDPARPQKLYYNAFPRLLLRIGVMMMRLQGQDPRRAGSNHDMDFQAILNATQPTHTRIYVAPYNEIGERAANCHASQIGPRQQFPGGAWLMRQLGAYTTMTRVYPAPKPNESTEIDLFVGVKSE